MASKLNLKLILTLAVLCIEPITICQANDVTPQVFGNVKEGKVWW